MGSEKTDKKQCGMEKEDRSSVLGTAMMQKSDRSKYSNHQVNNTGNMRSKHPKSNLKNVPV